MIMGRQMTSWALLLALVAGLVLPAARAQLAPFAPITTGDTDTELAPWTPPDEPEADMPSLPPSRPATTSNVPVMRRSPPSGQTVQPTGNCLTDGLAEAGLTSLLTAVEQAGLGGTFQSLDNVTILAPNNDAFFALSASLSGYPKGVLRSILSYHVVKGMYSKSGLGKASKGLQTELSDTDAVTTCGGSGKGGISVYAAGSSFVFEGTSSSAGLVEADLSVCDGAVTVHVISQVLMPCCFSSRSLLRGTPGQMKAVLINSSSTTITGFQDALLANATGEESKVAKAIFVPTASAWQAFNVERIFTAASMPAPGKTQLDSLLKLLALYHMSYDKAAISQLTTGTESQTILVSSLGRQSIQNPTCPQRLRLLYKPSVSAASAAPTFVVSSDDQKTSGKIVGYYQTCTGVNIYLVDAVLLPCNFVNLATLSSDGDTEMVDTAATDTTGVVDNYTIPFVNTTRSPITKRSAAAGNSAGLLGALVAALLLGVLA